MPRVCTTQCAEPGLQFQPVGFNTSHYMPSAMFSSSQGTPMRSFLVSVPMAPSSPPHPCLCVGVGCDTEGKGVTALDEFMVFGVSIDV